MTDATSLIDDIDGLHDIYADGMATVQAFNKVPVVTIRRRDAGGEFQNVTGLADLPVISIKRDNVQPREGALNQGAQELAMTGTIKAWHPFLVDIEDRFVWGGLTCEITTAPPDKLGIVQVCDFVILQSNQEP